MIHAAARQAGPPRDRVEGEYQTPYRQLQLLARSRQGETTPSPPTAPKPNTSNSPGCACRLILHEEHCHPTRFQWYWAMAPERE